jgi:hypothetical protein
MNEQDRTAAAEIFGDLIYSYTRAQALADGVLVDVSAHAHRAGIRYPTACTASVWALIDCIPGSDSDELAGIVRADALLRDMLAAIRQARGTDRVHFQALGAALWAQCGPGDTAAPVITIMRAGED